VAPDRAADLALLDRAAREASALALTFFGKDFRSWPKGADSIVSEADIALDDRLRDILRSARPDYGWLSEETADNTDRLSRRRVFVVDPIDGTRAFLAHGKEWAVSLAVVEEGQPIVAVLAAPALGATLRGVVGEGAFRNGARIAASGRKSLAGARFAGGRRYARAAAVAAGTGPGKVRYVPSLAWRIALVAMGEEDVAIARPGAMDWDLAAADLLVHEAGARLADLAGGRLRYNRTGTSHPALVATSPELLQQVARIVTEVDGKRAAGP
jgi:myo-inositol-1(or 4)-monophosphatase